MTTVPIRVCLFTDADVFAGTERHIFELGCALRTAGVSVKIASPDKSPLAVMSEQAGLTTLPIAKNGLVDRAAIRTVAQELRSGSLDIIHAHNGRTALIAALAQQAAGHGVCIATQHFLEPNHATQHGLKALPSLLAHRWVSARTRRFLAISQAVQQSMLARQEAPPEKIVVVPNGLSGVEVPPEAAADIRREFGIGRDAPLIVCVARLEREKDILTLLRAMPGVLGGVPEARALVVGTGAERASLEAAARELGIADAVQFAGFREDARAAIAAGDVFVLPSLEEPFGLVLLEAMALKRPIVATAVGGPLEIVVDGEIGYLVPPAAPERLASALQELLTAPERRSQMGAQGYTRYLKHYTAEKMAEGTIRVYQSVLTQKHV